MSEGETSDGEGSEYGKEDHEKEVKQRKRQRKENTKRSTKKQNNELSGLMIHYCGGLGFRKFERCAEGNCEG